MVVSGGAAKLHLSSVVARHPSLLHLVAVAALCSFSYLLGIWHRSSFSAARGGGGRLLRWSGGHQRPQQHSRARQAAAMVVGAIAAKLHLLSAAARRPSVLHLVAVAALCSLSYLLGIWHHGDFFAAWGGGGRLLRWRKKGNFPLSPLTYCDNPPRKIPYYRLNQSTLVIKQQ
jgi:hypothetical protein